MVGPYNNTGQNTSPLSRRRKGFWCKFAMFSGFFELAVPVSQYWHKCNVALSWQWADDCFCLPTAWSSTLDWFWVMFSIIIIRLRDRLAHSDKPTQKVSSRQFNMDTHVSNFQNPKLHLCATVLPRKFCLSALSHWRPRTSLYGTCIAGARPSLLLLLLAKWAPPPPPPSTQTNRLLAEPNLWSICLTESRCCAARLWENAHHLLDVSLLLANPYMERAQPQIMFTRISLSLAAGWLAGLSQQSMGSSVGLSTPFV